ncbi:hypothetical protein A2803_05720 [Candidatus Woesebacteria bacterium RIFCSPHIGHO2_01_FULL_44_21]|uniref:ATP synthase subunit b n=1 Tax=Candidatus Woesebacteria bacterium RIFCSPHIGHO2_01_FULL_44_21 TaxID=1802503 RepID=A0A1F7YZV4_9BACT|nr:MAG: hypothetical protein A2803_05720 [Candidatus Woesebacteria bacterium RIFCSPHIGHO2_01_FULL_44_21]OGM71108.1 MAG: hypothetical protein A2897_02705 [Candidatus Woesebacteria bacterium RIFCSPLOWO2_01_FULL_44_24b]
MEKLGIDPRVMIFQVVNFGILVFLLNRYLYKPVLKAIHAKKADLARIDDATAQISSQKESVERERAQMLKKLQEEKTQNLRASRLEAAKLKKETLASVQNDVKRLLEKAKSEIAAERTKLVKDYEKDVLATSLVVIEKALGEKADKKLESKLAQIASQVHRS